MFLDVVSVRKTMPTGMTLGNDIDFALVNERRVIPRLQITPNTLVVAKSGQTVTVSIRPGNCSFNLNPFSLVNSFDQVIFYISNSLSINCLLIFSSNVRLMLH